jgi:hypothetical protein
MFLLEFDLYSYADLRRPGVLAGLGRAFDADPRLRPDRMDVRDPIRNRIASAAGYLDDAVATIANEDILFERRREPHLAGELSAPSYRLSDRRESPHRLFAGTSDSDADWFRDTAHSEAFAALFVRLAGAFEGSYGFASDHQMWRQQAGEFARARRRGEFAPQTPGPQSDAHSVRDVYWLNYYGPAYLELWGGRLDGLGVRREATPNGGLVVWATETPFEFRDDAGSFEAYPWKKPWYEALGRESFVNARATSWEKRVPNRADHLRNLRTAPAGPSVPADAAIAPDPPDAESLEGRSWLFPEE